jgi:hypothetical protein
MRFVDFTYCAWRSFVLVVLRFSFMGNSSHRRCSERLLWLPCGNQFIGGLEQSDIGIHGRLVFHPPRQASSAFDSQSSFHVEPSRSSFEEVIVPLLLASTWKAIVFWMNFLQIAKLLIEIRDFYQTSNSTLTRLFKHHASLSVQQPNLLR